MKNTVLFSVFSLCILVAYTACNVSQDVAATKSAMTPEPIKISEANTTDLRMASPESVGMSSERLNVMEAKMHKFVDNGQLANVQTAVIRHGKIVQFDTYGYEDVDSKDPLKENSIFRIYSMTKPIVSIGLMMLYEEGKFQLNDPLHKYVPEFKEMQVHIGNGKTEPAKQPIRVIDVLRHTTGFGYGWGYPANHVDSLYKVGAQRGAMASNRDFLKAMSTLPLYHQPGSGWRYSVSTDVAGGLLEILADQPLDEFLKERIFQPLGMDDTHFEVPDAKDERFVSNYTHNKDGSLKIIDHPSMSKYCKEVKMFSGGGGLVSTSKDYLQFCQMLLNKGTLNGVQFVSPKTLALMTSDHTQNTPHAGGPIVLPARGTAFGLGFSVTTDLAASEMLGSEGAYGWGGAAGTYFRIDPKEDMAILMMIQVMPYNHLQAREKFHNLVYQAVVE